MLYNGRLDGRKIRLLHIELDTYRAPIRCQLAEASLDDLPSYEALSYVWGDPEATEAIVCNGEEVKVTVNLARALRRIRLGLSPPSIDDDQSDVGSKDDGPRDQDDEIKQNSPASLPNSRSRPYRPDLLWVDALCINQLDLVERSAQVQLMREVYGNATRVIIWLGDKKANMRLMSLVEATFEYVLPIADWILTFDDTTTLHSVVSTMPGGWQDLRLALDALFSSDWFSRVWCTQEAFLARKTCLLYRNAELISRDAAAFCEWILSTGQRDMSLRCLIYPSASTSRNLAQCLIRLAPSVFSKDEAFAMFLTSVRSLHATDPRDKFYGLLGILGAGTVDVDYSKAVAEVYIDSVLHTASNGLYVLSLVAHPLEYCRRGDLPSWVPDWSTGPNARVQFPLMPIDVRRDALASSRRQVARIDTCLARRGTLSLSGLLCDKVIYRSELLDSLSLFTQGNITPLHDIFLHLWDEVVTKRSPNSMSLLTWAKTFTAGRCGNYPEVGSATAADAKLMRNFWSFTSKLLSADEHVVVADDNRPGDSIAYQHLITEPMDRRRMFRTSKSWIGLGPRCLREGDVVAVFHGGFSSYILRPIADRPDHYHLMGECYVDSLTDEGGYRMVGDGGVEERTFYLV